MIIAFSFIMGRFPNDGVYTFTSIMLPLLIATRYVHYILVGWHMYLVDFCYFANALMLYFIWFKPKNEVLMTSFYLYATGPLAIGIVAFRNSLVYHKIDFLTSLAIHAVPLIMAHHVRWYTIPTQAHLPIEQQKFSTITPFAGMTWGTYFDMMLY